MIVRAFEVRANKEALVCNLSRYLNNELVSLQSKGWTIMSVTATKCKEYDYPKPFESTLFTIVASHESEE